MTSEYDRQRDIEAEGQRAAMQHENDRIGGKNRTSNLKALSVFWRVMAENDRLRAALVDLGAAYHACNGEDHPAYIEARAAIVQKEGD